MTTIETIEDARAHLRALVDRASATIAAGHRHPISGLDLLAVQKLLGMPDDHLPALVHYQALAAEVGVKLTPLNMHDDRTIAEKLNDRACSVQELPEVANLLAEMQAAGWQVADDNAVDGYVAIEYARYSETESFDVKVTIAWRPEWNRADASLKDSRAERHYQYGDLTKLRAAIDRRDLLVPTNADFVS